MQKDPPETRYNYDIYEGHLES
jgi:hypothetical protein